MSIKHSIHSSRSGLRIAHRQAGATLIEAMIGLGLSLIVVTSMVGLMSNSLGSATRIIQMSQLTDELRNTMSMMSRDTRRANFTANSIYCYSNSDCGIDGSANQSADISFNNSNDCFLFGLDRNFDGDASTDDGGGFRLQTSGGVGRIEMWVGDSSPSCAANDADWVAVTDPDVVNITFFNVNGGGSYTEDLGEEGGTTLTQKTREIQMQIQGELIMDSGITRRIEDTIQVRNDIYL